MLCIYGRVVCLLKTFSLQQLQQGEVREMWEEGERGVRRVRRKELRLKHNKNSYSFLSIFVWSTLALGLRLQREKERERPIWAAAALLSRLNMPTEECEIREKEAQQLVSKVRKRKTLWYLSTTCEVIKVKSISKLKSKECSWNCGILMSWAIKE